VKQLPEDLLAKGQIAPKAGQIFNPRAESPSIRKTPGIDHTKSKPLARNGQHVPPAVTAEGDMPVDAAAAAAAAAPALPPAVGPPAVVGGAMPRPGPPMTRGSVINPQFDQTRRIGAPGASSPLANRNQYRPPTMKRPPTDSGPPGRAPLSDVSSNVPATNGNGATAGGPDFKRQRMS
jgi:DNA repair and recombination protein RAD52